MQRVEGEPVQLPSGFVAKLRRLDPISMLAPDGSLPDSLLDIADQASNEQGGIASQLESYIKMKPVLDRLVKATFVTPIVGDEPDPENGQISLDAVSMADKLFVMSWVFGEMNNLALSFPEKPDGNLGTVSDSEGIRAAALSLAGDEA